MQVTLLIEIKSYLINIALVSVLQKTSTKSISRKRSLDICQHNDSNTLVNLCLHHKFILDRRCQFSSQIFVICGKSWFSAFIWRKLQLRLIEFSQVLTARLLLGKKDVVSGFNALKAVIWCWGPAWRWKRENFWRFRIGGITC